MNPQFENDGVITTPPSPAALRDQALALLREGVEARDLAAALGIDLTELQRLIGVCPDCQ